MSTSGGKVHIAGPEDGNGIGVVQEPKSVWFSELKSISMDMSDGFIKAVKENFENWEELICFDWFHVSQHFNKGLDQMRRKELEKGSGKNVDFTSLGRHY